MISRPTLDERVNSPAFTETTLSEVVEEAPRPGPITRMHPLTLRFDGELEEEFAEQYFRMTLTQVRVALILGIALYTVFGVLDTLIAPEQQRTLWMIRYAIVVPTWSVLFVFTYRPAFRRYREPELTSGSGLVGLYLLGRDCNATLLGLDIDGGAIRVAGQNARLLGLAERARFAQSDLWSSSTLKLLAAEKPQLLVCNPPYVPEPP